MTIDVKVVYAADRSSTEFSNLYTNTPISHLKELIAIENSLDSLDSIRVIQRGRILSDSTTLSSLFVSSRLVIVVYATGIPSKGRSPQILVKPRPVPVFEAPPVIEEEAIAEPENNRRDLWVGLVGLICFFGVIIYLAIPKDQIRVNNPRLIRWSGKSILLVFLVAFLFIALWIWVRKVDLAFFWKCTAMFFRSLLPTFHLSAFREANQ